MDVRVPEDARSEDRPSSPVQQAPSHLKPKAKLASWVANLSDAALVLRRLQGFLKRVLVVGHDVLDDFVVRWLHLPTELAAKLQRTTLTDWRDALIEKLLEESLHVAIRRILLALLLVLHLALQLELKLLPLGLVTLDAQAVVALPAVEDALACENVFATGVALVVSIRLPPLEAMTLRALWCHCPALPAAEEFLEDLAHEHLLRLLHPPHAGAAGSPLALAFPSPPAPPAEGKTTAPEQLVKHRLLIEIEVLVHAAKKCSKEVLEVLGVCILKFLFVDASCSVVQGPFVGIRQDLVSGGYLLEFRSGFGVVRILVRMPLQRQAPVGFPYFRNISVQADTKR
mmetsp:Transcript_40067/g.124884  ORF Transcript_40067/g.124884 Transcript_40067/m.124884 type:complete len:342 (-) Transcript_40067:97-1122(-)